MNLQECYAAFGGDYDSVIDHIQSESIVHKFVLRFLDDKSYEKLVSAIESGNYEEAFAAVHTLKGVCLNLCFKRLSESTSGLTELLRNKSDDEVDRDKCLEALEVIKKDYCDVVETIRKLS